jgi:hypothetical protein
LSAVLSAATTVAMGLSGRFIVPVALIATLAAMSAAQLMLSLRTRATAQALTTGVAGSAVTPDAAFAEPPNSAAPSSVGSSLIENERVTSFTQVEKSLSVREILGHSMRRDQFSETRSRVS